MIDHEKARLCEELDQLEERVRELEEALRPFAEAFALKRGRYARERSAWFDEMPGHWTCDIKVTMRDGRAAEKAIDRARRALEGGNKCQS